MKTQYGVPTFGDFAPKVFVPGLKLERTDFWTYALFDTYAEAAGYALKNDADEIVKIETIATVKRSAVVVPSTATAA